MTSLPRRSGSKRWRRALAAALGLVALALAPGVVLRGPVAVALVARASRGLCGSLSITGGGVDLTVLPRLLLGRTFGVRLEGVRLTDPAAATVLAVDRLDADVSVEWWSRRVAVEAAHAARGAWRLSVDPTGQSSFSRALARVGPAGRSSCGAPASPAPARPRAPGAPARPSEPGWALSVRGAELEAIDTELEFPGWGLVLERADARGDLRIGARGAVAFDVVDAISSRGTLRLGPPDTRWTFEAPFERVEIARVAGDTRRNGDIVLVVDEALSRQSRLSGRAVFGGALGGRRGGSRRQQLTMDARWTDVGRVLPYAFPNAEVDPLWTTAFGRDSTLLTIALEGPFNDPHGHVALEGGPLELALDLAPARASALRATARSFDVTPLLPAPLRPLVGGRVDGRLLAHGTGLMSAARAAIQIDRAALDLSRARPGPFPALWRVHVGPAADRDAISPTDLTLDVERAAFAQGALTLGGVQLAFPGAALDASGRLQLVDLLSGRGLPSPVTDVAIARAEVDFTQLLPGSPLEGRVTAHGRLHGLADDLTLALTPTADSEVVFARQRLRFPRELALRVRRGDQLSGAIALDRVDRDGSRSGSAAVEGSVVFDGAVDARARIDRWPLGAIATASGLPMPLPVAGTWSAAFHLSGATRDPAVDGRLTLAAVSVGEHPLGDGELRLRSPAAARGVRRVDATGVVVPGLALVASADVAPTGLVRASGRATLDRFGVGFLLPPSLRGIGPLDASGAIGASARAARGGPPRLAADGALELEGAAGDLRIRGALERGTVTANASGRIEVPAVARGVGFDGTTAGTLAIEAALERPFVAISDRNLDGVRGHARVDAPIVFRVPRLAAPVELAAGSELSLDAAVVRSQGLRVTTEGAAATLAGSAALAVDDPRATELDLDADVDVDAARLRAALPTLGPRGLTLAGRLGARGKLRGTIAAPLPDLALTLDHVVLGGPPLAAVDQLVADGRAALRDRAVTELDVRATLASGGTIRLRKGAGSSAVALDGAWPPGVATASLSLTGTGISTSRPLGPLDVRDAGFELTLDQHADGRLALRGGARLERVFVVPSRNRSGRQRIVARAEQRAEEVPWLRDLEVDLTLSSPRDGIIVPIPVLPDVTVGLACRLHGPAPGPALDGAIAGAGAYSSLLLTLYDWFDPRDVRGCRLLP